MNYIAMNYIAMNYIAMNDEPNESVGKDPGPSQ